MFFLDSYLGGNCWLLSILWDSVGQDMEGLLHLPQCQIEEKGMYVQCILYSGKFWNGAREHHVQLAVPRKLTS